MKCVASVTAFYLWLSPTREKCKLRRYYLLILGTFSCLLLQLAWSALLWVTLGRSYSETYCILPREVFLFFISFLFFYHCTWCQEIPGLSHEWNCISRYYSCPHRTSRQRDMRTRGLAFFGIGNLCCRECYSARNLAQSINSTSAAWKLFTDFKKVKHSEFFKLAPSLQAAFVKRGIFQHCFFAITYLYLLYLKIYIYTCGICRFLCIENTVNENEKKREWHYLNILFTNLYL